MLQCRISQTRDVDIESCESESFESPSLGFMNLRKYVLKSILTWSKICIFVSNIVSDISNNNVCTFQYNCLWIFLNTLRTKNVTKN